MFLDFHDALRRVGVRVSLHEWMTLMEALQSGLVEPSLVRFYYAARAILIKRETDFDRFDQAFLEVFTGVEGTPAALDEVLAWLENPKEPPALSPGELEALRAMDLEALRELFEQRLREQDARHDGGNRWIGTGGTSPFGHGGRNPAGVRVGGSGGGRSAVQIATARQFQNYRDDVVIDVRQMQVALRKLRRLRRVGREEELDLDETIDRTGRNAGDLELVFHAPRKNQIRLILLMDAGGSMTPFTRLCSTLFTAASKVGHWKSFEAYYFHNCIYETVWTDIELRKTASTSDVLRAARENSVLVLVGDATMHPGELTERWGAIDYWHRNDTPGIEWLWRLRRAFPSSVWLNPMPERWWNSPSLELIRRAFPMYPLTLEGMDRATRDLRTGAV